MLLMEISFRKKILAGGFPETANLFPIHFPAYVRRKKSKETSQEGSDKWMMMMISLASKKNKDYTFIAHEQKKLVNYLTPTTKTKHTCVISPNHLIKNEALMHPTYINQILVLWVGAIWM